MTSLLAFLVLVPAFLVPGAAAARTTSVAWDAWVAPLAGEVVVRRAFSPPAVRWGTGHRGVDLASSAGAVVRAAGAGEVTFAGTLAGRGVLVVTHGALRTTYEPVRPVVAVGTRVAAGTVVARLAPGHAGPRGSPGEALLHWGLLRGETYLDPLALLPRGPSRLVPVPAADPVRPGSAAGAAPPVRAPPGPLPDRGPVPGPGPGSAAARGLAAVAAVVGVAGVAGVRRARLRAGRA